MPELPEVETVRSTLSKLVIGKKVSSVDVRFEKMIKNTDVLNFEDTLTDQTIKSIRRYGKYLFFDFDKNTLVSHLRMEGKYNYYNQLVEPSKHDHVIFYFTDEPIMSYGALEHSYSSFYYMPE